MTRREFLATAAAPALPAASAVPWYRRTYRWGQTNITENDLPRYDIAFWREYWKKTEVQGVIVNAGGIVAYYPSKYELHERARFLGSRDLYGELCEAAHKDGLAVLARMDSNRASEALYRAQPEWFARDRDGNPYRAAERYVTCVNSAYYDAWIPNILREIAERSHPEGFTDNSWAGLGRDSICYCRNCERKFRARTGKPVPRAADWDDATYREWIVWNYERRLEIWDQNNRVTQAAGGRDCIWVGMNSGSITGQSRSFRDLKEICRRAPMMLLDHQRRDDLGTFEDNGDTGKLVHGLLGWNKLMPESMSLYQSARNSFRLSAKPAPEARLWMIEGIAGGIQPWWHHISAYHEDKRAYRTAEPLMRWHRKNETYLLDREPVAAVGLLWSQRNTDFYGRDDARNLVDLPYRGFAHAMVRARIPYLPVHADHVERDASRISVLVLPGVAALSDAQCAEICRFVERGGSLIATGISTLLDEWGTPRADFALADLFGAHTVGTLAGSHRKQAAGSFHTYLRLPAATGARHPVLAGFEETEILPFGGRLEKLTMDAGAQAPLTFVPEFPVYPPETAWMREPKTDIPGLVLSTRGASRIAYMPADIDRRLAKDNLPDHARLLENLVRWAAGGAIPLAVEGRGLIDCHLYRQPGRLILHVVNLTSVGTWRAPVYELIPVGPLRVRVKLPAGVKPASARLLVAERTSSAVTTGGWVAFEISSVLDHELVVIE